MKVLHGLALVASVCGLAAAAHAQSVPESPEQVARPQQQMAGVPQLSLVKVADGFNDPTNVAKANDGSGRLFVTERIGRIQVVNADGSRQEEPFLDLTRINPLGNVVQTGFVEQGLFSVAFHPNFQENGHFFVHYSSLPFNGDGMIVRFTVDPENPDVVTADRANETAKVIMRIEQPWYNHNGGTIAFGPDGYLYITSGDGGWEGDPLQAGRDLSTRLGKILRIDVDVPEDAREPYAIPEDNPFAGAATERLMNLFGITEEQFAEIRVEAEPEIWALGLRNPYHITFDEETGDLYIADVGQNHWEEINWQAADSSGGEDYGWPMMEGSFCHPITGELPQENGRYVTQEDCAIVGTLPVAEYPHDQPYPDAAEPAQLAGCSVQGLGVATYGERKVYLSGDWCTGRLWGLGWNERDGGWEFAELAQTELMFTGGTVGEDGAVYAVNCNCAYLSDVGPEGNPPGALWRVTPADQVAEGAETAAMRAPQQAGQPEESEQQAE